MVSDGTFNATQLGQYTLSFTSVNASGSTTVTTIFTVALPPTLPPVTDEVVWKAPLSTSTTFTGGSSVPVSFTIVNSTNSQVIVEVVNVVKRHVKPNQKNPQGGRIEKEMPIHISNVLPVTASSGKWGTRVRFQTQKDGSKVRVAAKGGDVLSTLRKAK